MTRVILVIAKSEALLIIMQQNTRWLVDASLHRKIFPSQTSFNSMVTRSRECYCTHQQPIRDGDSRFS